MKTKLSVISTVIFFGLICFVGEAHAGAECYRNADCAGEALCLDLACYTPAESLATCQNDGECDGWQEICHDEFCKKDGSACSNDAGECIEGDNWGSCDCLNGEGTGWESSEDPPPMPGDELYANCVTSLVNQCGEEKPDLYDYCDDKAQISLCESFMQKYFDMANYCYGDYDQEVGFSDIAMCCEELNGGDSDEFQSMIDCITPLAPKDCEGLEECLYYGGDTDTDTDWDSDSSSDSDTDSDTDSDSDSDSDSDTDSDTDTGNGADPDGNTSSGCSVTSIGNTSNATLFTILQSMF